MVTSRTTALFARHGLADTSLQQITDAVRYSKAGLLRHFPSKEAICRAAVTAARDQAVSVLSRVNEIPAGADSASTHERQVKSGGYA